MALAAWWATITNHVLGDPVEAALAPKPTSYEDVHTEVQSILLPPTLPKGVTVHVQQPLNKHFALMHKVGLAPGEMKQTMFGPMPGPGHRFYALGAIVTHVGAEGGKWRAAGQYDAENGVGKATLLGDVWGNGRLRVHGQLEEDRKAPGTAWAATATLRGDDYVAVARAKDGPELGVSYNQRLAPGSAVTAGGEMMLSGAELRKAAGEAKPGAPRPTPIEWAVGAALDNGLHKSAVHYARTRTFGAGIFSAHHLLRLTDRSSLAAKLMVNPVSRQSMVRASAPLQPPLAHAGLSPTRPCVPRTGATADAPLSPPAPPSRFASSRQVAVGYKMRFRNTGASIYGMVDSYGTLRQVIEREPLKDFKVAASLETKLWPGSAAPGDVATLGFKVTMGSAPPFQPPLSPITMTRGIFAAS